MIKQRTIKKAVKARGIGIHSGAMINMTLIPAEIDHGVVFRRLDVGGKLIRAHNAFVNEVILSTSIENQGVKISTVEHLMSAFSALGIDNVLVELDSFEVPIMDGSSAPFIFLVQSAGIEDQDAHKKFFVIKDTIRVENNDSWAQVTPYEGFKVTLEIDFNHKKVKESGQNLSIDFAQKSYLKEISRARTFGYMRDVKSMQERNLALGASMDNAIALSDDDVLNEDGMRYENEFVKHKILDIVGDLYLLGANLIGHYEGYKTGHLLNDQLLSAILKQPDTWSIETFESENSPIQFYSEDWQNSL
ncbi:UDP-3-O-[3-hydroxymyristoyl] N-acetylglucosamine deacetylase (EC 3.5.1.108) [uncultured Gammaproteobacteria bacterium]|jgi:UDP-3-O-[3-hydroxymyristoyl] N-acetylglucosamine deacetylase|uniref:UDP-3-O-acyl-N-acetylglucosamine deacetylase n=1 Tax=thiotrophic endosymbiont of Bathymodiolus puteoserpentis (Logatchev) TaxID=343240 RepID=UPI0010B3DA74|nr:UDP-3-O-acyl-N-acetylglucosamine deacetylase [thiotrophic endosymbiont of Bathymodiolus puteoserpentis (Logatchev)]CAC9498342.1 UDP-3-O-[3-hydroxymyristoyl] N-acetylglucosamine deacetylase (EC 3.5.1.108) [uncultured Gammaproteobacteria bacterium]CAC9584956.1 UDP-3-O-[3-hydroxymyristoyl] N-acetylglucosamine deacetylase (EC 3.5.1.108) [uncultured Gammaproteobacteria bacterium]CAC9589734.1 UDP-3-O-[3-hydroxymyristoyl] N-acetylglucosamine deacetylase (EC 3.5.1.108) [uncultured Gammaproteobacteria